MYIIKELWEFIKVRKKYWLLPVILSLLILSVFIVVSEGTAMEPFIYAIF